MSHIAKVDEPADPAARSVSGKGIAIRAVVYSLLIVLWIGIAGVGGPTFGKLSDVQTNDQTAFLPASAEATQALEWQNKFRTSDAIPAVVLVTSESGVDQKQAAALAEQISFLLEGAISRAGLEGHSELLHRAKSLITSMVRAL